jgi:hypothetical protein
MTLLNYRKKLKVTGIYIYVYYNNRLYLLEGIKHYAVKQNSVGGVGWFYTFHFKILSEKSQGISIESSSHMFWKFPEVLSLII